MTGTYTDALAKIIESKREDKPLPDTPEAEQPGKVFDLVAALTESVQQAKASRGEDAHADVDEMPKKKTAKKRRARRHRPRLGSCVDWRRCDVPLVLCCPTRRTTASVAPEQQCPGSGREPVTVSTIALLVLRTSCGYRGGG